MEMIEVPLADGKTGELLENTVVLVSYPNGESDFAYAVEHGYTVSLGSKSFSWDNKYVVEVYEKVDLPEPKASLPQGIGATYRSHNNPAWYVTRIAPDKWITRFGEFLSDFSVEELSNLHHIYLVSEGVVMVDPNLPTVWKDCDGDYWKMGDEGYQMWNAPRGSDTWGGCLTGEDPSVDYAPFVDATSEFYEKYPNA